MCVCVYFSHLTNKMYVVGSPQYPNFTVAFLYRNRETEKINVPTTGRSSKDLSTWRTKVKSGKRHDLELNLKM